MVRNPSYGSRPCLHRRCVLKCFNIDDNNRNGKSFVCTVCAHEDDADHNAAVNIEQRAFDGEVTEIVNQYLYSTKKRHVELKELFKKRHRSCREIKLAV